MVVHGWGQSFTPERAQARSGQQQRISRHRNNKGPPSLEQCKGVSLVTPHKRMHVPAALSDNQRDILSPHRMDRKHCQTARAAAIDMSERTKSWSDTACPEVSVRSREVRRRMTRL